MAAVVEGTEEDVMSGKPEKLAGEVWRGPVFDAPFAVVLGSAGDPIAVDATTGAIAPGRFEVGAFAAWALAERSRADDLARRLGELEAAAGEARDMYAVRRDDGEVPALFMTQASATDYATNPTRPAWHTYTVEPVRVAALSRAPASGEEPAVEEPSPEEMAERLEREVGPWVSEAAAAAFRVGVRQERARARRATRGERG